MLFRSRYSPLLESSNLALEDDPITVLRGAQAYIDKIKSALNDEVGQSIIHICSLLNDGKILRLPEVFMLHLGSDMIFDSGEDEDKDDDALLDKSSTEAEQDAWGESLTPQPASLKTMLAMCRHLPHTTRIKVLRD